MVKKVKKFLKLLPLILVVFLVLMLCFHIRLSGPKYYIYESEEYIVLLFEENMDDFEEYVQRFYNHRMWGEYSPNDKNKVYGSYKIFRDDVTDEEYAFLEEFDQKFHPRYWHSDGIEVWTSMGHISFVKDYGYSNAVWRAESNGDRIEYYENGWRCIYYYPPNATQ